MGGSLVWVFIAETVSFNSIIFILVLVSNSERVLIVNYMVKISYFDL